MKKKIARHSLAWILAFLMIPNMMLLTFGVIAYDEKPAYAAGYTTANITPTSGSYAVLHTTITPKTWTEWATSTNSESMSTTGGFTLGWNTYPFGTPEPKFCQMSGMMGFVLDPPAGSVIVSARVFVKQNASITPGAPADWGMSYVSLFKTIDADGTATLSDWSEAYNQGSIMVTQPKTINSLEPGAGSIWRSYEIYSGYINSLLSWRDANKRIWFTMAMQRRMIHGSGAAPTWSDFKSCYSGISYGAGVYPYLQVTYVTPPPDRTMYVPPNAAKNPLKIGTEIADNITWVTPRVLYGDEDAAVQINGESGANITLRMVTDGGQLIATTQDEVRINGKFYWTVELPPGINDYIRVYEDKNNLKSTWGIGQPVPSATQQNLMVYAKDTAYPQYDNPFSDYVIRANGVMFVHWQTNITSGEVSSYGVRMFLGGTEVSGLAYSQTFDWLNANYYSCTNANNTLKVAWRYALFCPQVVTPGFDNRDGLIQDMALQYSPVTSGFWTPVIYAVSDNTVLTITHSDYWYLSKTADGVDMSIDSNMVATVTAGSASKIPSRLSNIVVQIIDSSGLIKGYGYGVAEAGTVTIPLPMVTTAGEYQARFIFYDATWSPYYNYVHDIPFTVSAVGVIPGGEEYPTPEGGLGIVDSMLKRAHLDNDAGHWFLILASCIILALVFRKMPAVATCLVLLIFAGAWIAKWIPQWFIVLLIIGAGLSIFGLFKRKTNTSNES